VVQLLQAIGIFEIDERGHASYDVDNEMCRIMSATSYSKDCTTTLVSMTLHIDSTQAHESTATTTPAQPTLRYKLPASALSTWTCEPASDCVQIKVVPDAHPSQDLVGWPTSPRDRLHSAMELLLA
jgi:hypothetical protein